MAVRRRAGISTPRAAVVPLRPATTDRVVPQERAETASVEAFVAARGEQLLRLAYLVTGSHADAEDLLGLTRLRRNAAIIRPDLYSPNRGRR